MGLNAFHGSLMWPVKTLRWYSVWELHLISRCHVLNEKNKQPWARKRRKKWLQMKNHRKTWSICPCHHVCGLVPMSSKQQIWTAKFLPPEIHDKLRTLPCAFGIATARPQHIYTIIMRPDYIPHQHYAICHPLQRSCDWTLMFPSIYIWEDHQVWEARACARSTVCGHTCPTLGCKHTWLILLPFVHFPKMEVFWLPQV